MNLIVNNYDAWKIVLFTNSVCLHSVLLSSVVLEVLCYVPEPSAVFQASLACGRLLLRVPGGVVMEMLQFNRTLMALATLMYAPVPIEEVGPSHYYHSDELFYQLHY